MEVPVINERVGKDHIRGIYIRPEYPVYSTQAARATFILSNHSGGDLTCGEHYYITFEDGESIWRELPINTAFWNIAYQGRVIVSVVIDENGCVTDPVIIRSRDSSLDEEALRIAGLMPRWKPGMQQGKAVKVEFTFPVAFRLE